MKAILFAILAGLCWGIGEACTRSALHAGRIGPISAITVRSLVAIPLLVATYWLMARGTVGLKVEPPLAQVDATTWAKLVLGSGLVAGAVAMICFYIALSLGEVSVVKPIAFSIAPVVGVLLGWLVLGESMDARKAIAIGLIVTESWCSRPRESWQELCPRGGWWRGVRANRVAITATANRRGKSVDKRRDLGDTWFPLSPRNEARGLCTRRGVRAVEGA